MVKEATLPLATEIDALKVEVTKMRESLEFISAQYEDIKREHCELLTENIKHNNEISVLTESTKDLKQKSCTDEDKIDQLEQYDRRQNLEFEGLALKRNEDVTQLVVNVASKIGVKIRKTDISVAHRLPPKRYRSSDNTSIPPTVIARFVKREV